MIKNIFISFLVLSSYSSLFAEPLFKDTDCQSLISLDQYPKLDLKLTSDVSLTFYPNNEDGDGTCVIQFGKNKACSIIFRTDLAGRNLDGLPVGNYWAGITRGDVTYVPYQNVYIYGSISEAQSYFAGNQELQAGYQRCIDGT